LKIHLTKDKACNDALRGTKLKGPSIEEDLMDAKSETGLNEEDFDEVFDGPVPWGSSGNNLSGSVAKDDDGSPGDDDGGSSMLLHSGKEETNDN
jgi:hypothetical protein